VFIQHVRDARRWRQRDAPSFLIGILLFTNHSFNLLQLFVGSLFA
jgi:hypothetical protein